MIEIVISDIKNNKDIIQGIENVTSAELLLPPLVKCAYDVWNKQPNEPGLSTRASLSIVWLGLSYVFHDHYWD